MRPCSLDLRYFYHLFIISLSSFIIMFIIMFIIIYHHLSLDAIAGTIPGMSSNGCIWSIRALPMSVDNNIQCIDTSDHLVGAWDNSMHGAVSEKIRSSGKALGYD